MQFANPLFYKIIQRFKKILGMIHKSKIIGNEITDSLTKIEGMKEWDFPLFQFDNIPKHPDDDGAKTSPSVSKTTESSPSKAPGANSLESSTTNVKKLVTVFKDKLEKTLQFVWPCQSKDFNAEAAKQEAITLTSTISTEWQEIKTQYNSLSKANYRFLEQNEVLRLLLLWANGIDEKDVVSLDSEQRIIDAKLAQSISSLEHDLSVLIESMRLFAVLNVAVASCCSLQVALKRMVVFNLSD